MTRQYERLVVSPISGALGADVEGVSLRDMDSETFQEVLHAWDENVVLFFRDQHLTPSEFEGLGSRFGKPSIVHYTRPMEGTVYVNQLVREADAARGSRNIGDSWHTDMSVRVEPPAGLLLQSVDTPLYGGDTMFANLYLAYEDLSEGLKSICDQLIVVHSPGGTFSESSAKNGKRSINSDRSSVGLKSTPEQMEQWYAMETGQPLVCEHHRTGRRYLYLSGTRCIRFEGWTEEESRPLLDYLHNFAQKPERTCRFRWSQGAVALLDNNAAAHYAVNDYAGFRREMYRMQFSGPAPIGPAKRERTSDEYEKDRLVDSL
jgi:taurine dioxygenase